MDALPIPVDYIRKLEEENKKLKEQIAKMEKVIRRWGLWYEV